MSAEGSGTRWSRWARALLVLVSLAAAGSAWVTCHLAAPDSGRVARDPMLRRLGVRVYSGTGSPRALVVFFGNDVGFWQPHRELAADLAARGYAVVGVDIRGLLGALPEPVAARETAFVAAIIDLVARARGEVTAGGAPVVLAGHSLGAELALWAAAHAPIAELGGVVAIAPGTRSHLRVSPTDLLGREPTDAGSFAITDVMALLAKKPLRVALVRGSHDHYGWEDSLMIASAGARARRFTVPFAGHSMRSLAVAQYVISDAMRWALMDAGTGGVARAPRLSARGDSGLH